MATFSLLSGIGSAVFGVGLFSLVYFHVYLELFPGGVFLTLLFLGGLWLCLAVLAIVLGAMALRRLPKASGHGGEIAQAAIGLSLGIGNLLVALAVFIVLLSVINTPPHSEDSIPGRVV